MAPDSSFITPSGWQVTADGKALEREFKFKDFSSAWTFMCRIASIAEAMDHHPDWSNTYNRVSIRLTTHETGGLSNRDQVLAEKINDLL